MGSWGRIIQPLSNTKVLILDSGAKHNYMLFQPPIDQDIFNGESFPNKKFLWEDNSGNDTNIIVPRLYPGLKSNPAAGQPAP